MNKKYDQYISYLFIVMLFVMGITTIVLPDEEISDIENRTLVTFSSLYETNYIDNSFQDTLENALIDQFFWRYPMVDFKNEMEYLFSNVATSNTSDAYILRALGDSGVMQISNTNYMMDEPILYKEGAKERVADKTNQINELQSRNPNTDIFIYLPVNQNETSLFDESNNISSIGEEYISIIENNSQVSFDKFEVDSIADIHSYFHTSDHHLNHVGLNLMYSDVMNLIGYPNEIKQPINEICTPNQNFYGTFSSRTGFILEGENFCVYEYEIDPYEIAFEGNIVEKDGANTFTQYLDKESSEERPYYYNIAYEGHDPLAVYDFNQTEKPNVLVVGDSLSRGFIEVFASSFNKTYRLVPYSYTAKHGYFNYDSFIEENEIDIVLFTYGLVNYYYQDEWGDRYLETTIIDPSANN